MKHKPKIKPLFLTIKPTIIEQTTEVELPSGQTVRMIKKVKG